MAFVEIRDPATGRPVEVLHDSIPMVEEWKKATADYKAAAIPLGRFDMPPEQSVANSPYAPAQPQSQSGATFQSSLPRSPSTSSITRQQRNGPRSAPLYRPEHDPMLPPGELTALSVPSFHNESGNYWFRLHVTFVPDEPSAPAYTLSLYRTYEDFYDFQITLLDTFPYEAGRPRPGEEDRPPPERILPYMPGPVKDEIDDDLTEYRREELDAYVKALIDLRRRGAGYIVRHELFRTFFAAKYGDYCEDAPRQDAVEELEERLGEVRVAPGEAGRSGNVKGYSQDMRTASAASRNSQNPAAQENFPGPARTTSRGPSPLPPIDTHLPTSRPESLGYSAGARQSGGTHYVSGGMSTATTSYPSWGAPTSASVPLAGQPPYVKIKIYDRATDDLIAIRVHPNVSHTELLEKVRARLGPEVSLLRYRASMAGGANGALGYREIRDDRELKDWLRTEDQKLVLYAEQG